MRFLLYTSRNGETTLTEHSQKGFEFLLSKAERDNRMSLEQARQQGFDMDGSYAQGFWWMDDGGSIDTIVLEDI